jgi:hypothetical protein
MACRQEGAKTVGKTHPLGGKGIQMGRLISGFRTRRCNRHDAGRHGCHYMGVWARRSSVDCAGGIETPVTQRTTSSPNLALFVISTSVCLNIGFRGAGRPTIPPDPQRASTMSGYRHFDAHIVPFRRPPKGVRHFDEPFSLAGFRMKRGCLPRGAWRHQDACVAGIISHLDISAA